MHAIPHLLMFYFENSVAFFQKTYIDYFDKNEIRKNLLRRKNHFRYCTTEKRRLYHTTKVSKLISIDACIDWNVN